MERQEKINYYYLSIDNMFSLTVFKIYKIITFDRSPYPLLTAMASLNMQGIHLSAQS